MSNKNRKKQEKRPAQKPALSLFAWPILIILSFVALKEYFSKFRPDIDSFIFAISPSQYISSGIFKAMYSNTLSLIKGLFSFLGIFGWGYLAMRFIKLDESGSSLAIVSLALGLFITAVFSAITGISGILIKEAFLFFAFCGFAISAFAIYSERKKIDKLKGAFFAEFPLFWLFLSVIVVINLIQSLSPETFYDTIIYHLAVPNYWKIEGAIKDMPNLIFSKMPFNHGLVYLYCLETGNVESAKFVNWGISLFTLFSFFAFFKGKFSQKTLFVAASIFFSIFHYMNVSWYASNDAMLSFFLLCSFYLSLRYSETLSFKYAIVSGLLAGFAMGIKYTSSIFVFATLFSILYMLRENLRLFVKFAIVFFLAASLPVLPWLVKNFIYYGNPFYPMLYKVFQKGLDPLDISHIESFMSEVRQFDFNLKDWLMHPLYVSVGKIANDEYFTPIFLIVLPLAFFNRKENPLLKPLMIYFVSSWLMWSFSSNVVRYLMPAWFAGALLVSFYAFEAFEGLFGKTVRFLVLFTIILSFYWSFMFFYMEAKWKVFFGINSASDYLSSSKTRYPWPSYAVFDHIKKVSKDKERTLFLGDSKTLYFEKPFEASSVFDRNILIDICLNSKDEEEIYLKLRELGIKRIIFNIKEAMRNNSVYGILYFDSKSMDRFDKFFNKHMREEYIYDEKMQDQIVNRVIVYEINEKNDKSFPNYIKDVYLKTSGRKI